MVSNGRIRPAGHSLGFCPATCDNHSDDHPALLAALALGPDYGLRRVFAHSFVRLSEPLLGDRYDRRPGKPLGRCRPARGSLFGGLAPHAVLLYGNWRFYLEVGGRELAFWRRRLALRTAASRRSGAAGDYVLMPTGRTKGQEPRTKETQ